MKFFLLLLYRFFVKAVPDDLNLSHRKLEYFGSKQ